ncbi:hypothetical protein CPAR01_06432 [Colletotrichum paranaense]|uniref:Uncharacterized protein n=1 Tax=Colletotrichum paranaense TaxID=1914294 RepID=A0ABQ9SLX5_9PEZI|nr:uncharacterized protein CPAR01_06432 [Colletotrichum paranaense]KAK1540443.1 hypothetical protein CPAR01_06432 [Colletotrichum paranaense]
MHNSGIGVPPSLFTATRLMGERVGKPWNYPITSNLAQRAPECYSQPQGDSPDNHRNIRWLLQSTGYLDLDRGSRRANASPRAQTFPKQLAQLLSSFAVAVEEMHGMEGQCCAFSLR